MNATKKSSKSSGSIAKTGRSILVFLLLIAAIGAIAFVTIYRDGSSMVKEKTVIYLPKGSDYSALLDSLDGKVTDLARFKTIAKVKKLDESVKAGRYELRSGMSAREAVSMFRAGNQTPLKITFNNIRTTEELAGRLGSQLMADSVTFLALLNSSETAQTYGFTKPEFIGMFIPNTYEVYWTISPEAFFDRMKQEYDRFWSGSRASKLERTKLTAKEVSALAAIVEEESSIADEMPAIAGVYINRLRRGMLLQADPTVKFAVGDPTLRRVLHKHLAIDSPYNTYKYKGLPPGPIRMPSVQAIDAVLNYQKHDYLYFCAKADFSGRHAFAKTLTEHNKNAQAYARALNAAGIK